MPGTKSVEHRLTPVMSVLALLWLVLLSALAPSMSTQEPPKTPLQLAYAGTLAAIWILFFVEFLAFLIVQRRSLNRNVLGYALLAAVAPPLRIGRAPLDAPGTVWIPFGGWTPVCRDTQKRIEAYFSAPMMLVALLILPVLVLELAWSDWVAHFLWLQLALDTATRFIWLAFAIEFSVMVAITGRKLEYAMVHWIDLAIILLPLVSFLRVLQLLQVGRLATLQKSLRLYRLRGTGARFVRALFLLRFLERRSHRAAKLRLGHLKSRLERRQVEMDELLAEIADLERHVHEHESRAAAMCDKPEGHPADNPQ